ncbi:hypothetical protein RD792_003238 [Penstemon davidsonii]|uniref:CP-type G domain-containing protein n=1 Tax=Penstemon davidsonii TaxID=160366 RepID=A0ABR0DU48_9LAMI|nr:hypothetical protein RD792_003238 [Penstemon davidsonii]
MLVLTESKSKRVPLRKKHKILKKVKEHHKKKAKEAKKLGFNNNTKTKVEKDPEIPNDLPLNDEELQALKDRRQSKIQQLNDQKAARQERTQKRKLGMLDDENMEEQISVGEERVTDDSIGTTRNRADHSERAFYKELVKVIDASDVILEVLDARDPLGTRCADMEKMLMRSGADKHLVLLLNKIGMLVLALSLDTRGYYIPDLVPREAVEKWLKYLREEAPTVAFKCSTQEQKSNLGWKSAPKASKTGKAGSATNFLQTSDCLGAETLIKLLKNYSRSHDVLFLLTQIKKSVTVGVIGLPNVGKSSLINSLKRSHVVNVGATPGLTRSMQEVQLDKHVKLLDCPGVVMLKSSENDASVALRNCKRIEKLDDPVAPVKEILKLCPENVLVTLYKVPSFDSVDDFLQKVAIARGKLKKGGIVDVGAAARIVLHDWNEGKIPYYTMPPTRNVEDVAEAKIVSELGKEFNVDEIYGGESSFIGSLKSVDDFSPVGVPTNCPLNFDMMVEGNGEPQAPTRGVVDDDQHMEAAEEDSVPGEDKFTNRVQNKKLYKEEGMLNTKLRKSDKKRRKKENKQSAAMEHDYDFQVEDATTDAAMDVGNEDVVADGNIKNRFELPSGVDLDNE